MMRWLRDRARERCTSIGIAILVGLGVGVVADVFPTAENALLHYGMQLLTAAIGTVLIGFRDQSLVWVRDAMLFSPRAAPALAKRKDLSPMPLFDDILAIVSPQMATLALDELGIKAATLVPEAQAVIADFQAVKAKPSVLGEIKLVADAAETIHDLATQLAALKALQPAGGAP